MGTPSTEYQPPHQFPRFPTVWYVISSNCHLHVQLNYIIIYMNSWFLSAYVRDVWSRLPILQFTIVSMIGEDRASTINVVVTH